MAIPRDLSAAVHDLLYDLHELKVTSLQAGATPADVLSVELYHLAGTIVAYADDEARQQAVLTYVLDTLPGLVYQRQQTERWRLASRGCLEQ
jgi:hypothetical protein